MAELMLIDRQAVQRELGQVFDQSTTRVLVNVLDRVAAQVYTAGMTRSSSQALQATMRELAAAQARTEAAVEKLIQGQARTEAAVEKLIQGQARTDAVMQELAAAQARTDERLGRLEKGQAVLQQDVTALQKGQAVLQQDVTALQKGQAVLQQDVTALQKGQAVLQQDVTALQKGQAVLQEGQASMQDTLGVVKGRQLELVYKERVGTYFGPLLRRVRVLSITQIEDDLEAHLSTEEFRDLLKLDLLVRGRPRHLPDAPQVWLAVEVSGVVDRHDVERAVRRAGHLSRVGYVSVPAVAGEQATEGAEALAREEGVLLVLDGRTDFWERALERVLEAHD